MQGAEETGAAPGPAPVPVPVEEIVGSKVMVEGMAVTIPGFWGTHSAQIPVK